MTFARITPATRAAQREAERDARAAALVAGARGMHRGTYGGEARPAPKSTPYRDPALLEMARGRPCLLLVPAVCSHRVDTTAAAHSNLQEHGKGKARKADDCYSAWACSACHAWLDQGPAPRAVKTMAFTMGHINQVQAWRQIATDAAEPERFRRAARRALEHLNATPPIGDAT